MRTRRTDLNQYVRLALTAVGALILFTALVLDPDKIPEYLSARDLFYQRIFSRPALVEVIRTYRAAFIATGAAILGFGILLPRLRRAFTTARVLNGWRPTFLAGSVVCVAFLAAAVSGWNHLYVHNDLVFYLFVAPTLSGGVLFLLAIASFTTQMQVTVLLSVLAATELTCWSVKTIRTPSVANERIVSGGGSLVENSAITGYIPRPNGAAEVRKTVEGKTVYTASYHFDRYSRRVVPVADGPRERFILFFGGSRTFGEGVSDDETIPYYVGRRLTDYRPYSYSYSGWGPAQFLALLRSRDLEDEVPERVGIVAYLMIGSHVRRTVGSYRIATRYNGGSLPYFVRDGGNIVRRGMFVKERPIRQFFYALLSKSVTFNSFVTDLPVDMEDYAFTADIVLEIRRVLSQVLDVERFVVFFHPGDPELEPMPSLLEAREIEYVSLIDLFDQTDERYIHSVHDTHLNPAGNQTVADAIVEYLRR